MPFFYFFRKAHSLTKKKEMKIQNYKCSDVVIIFIEKWRAQLIQYASIMVVLYCVKKYTATLIKFILYSIFSVMMMTSMTERRSLQIKKLIKINQLKLLILYLIREMPSIKKWKKKENCF